jgi:gluconate 5-dehydrogenase
MDINPEGLANAVTELSAISGNSVMVKGYHVDVTHGNAVKEAAGQVESDLGPVTILINNAGILRAGIFLDRPVAD